MRPQTVAVFDGSGDTVAMLLRLLDDCGVRGIPGPPGDGNSHRFDINEYMGMHDPEAIIWDIAPPLDRNWTFFKLLRRIGPLEGRAIVLTTTNKQQLDVLVGHDFAELEVVAKPYDPQLVVDAVMRAVDKQRAVSKAFSPSGV